MHKVMKNGLPIDLPVLCCAVHANKRKVHVSPPCILHSLSLLDVRMILGKMTRTHNRTTQQPW